MPPLCTTPFDIGPGVAQLGVAIVTLVIVYLNNRKTHEIAAATATTAAVIAAKANGHAPL